MIDARRRLLPPPLESAGRRVVWWCVVAVLVVALTGMAIKLTTHTVSSRAAASPATPPVATSQSMTPSSSPPAARTGSVEVETETTTAAATRPPSWPDAKAPKPGVYTYRATVAGVPGPASLVVRDVGGGRTTERLSVGGSVNQRTVRWQAGRATLLDTYSRDGSCAYEPTPTALVLPLHRGASWRTTGTCRSRSGAVDLSESVRVTGAAVVKVSGEAVPVWVIQRWSTTTARSSSAKVVTETRTTDLFAPGLGLVVYQTGRSASPDASGTVQDETWTLELVTSSPAS